MEVNTSDLTWEPFIYPRGSKKPFFLKEQDVNLKHRDRLSLFAERNGVDLIKVIEAIKVRPTHNKMSGNEVQMMQDKKDDMLQEVFKATPHFLHLLVSRQRNGTITSKYGSQ